MDEASDEIQSQGVAQFFLDLYQFQPDVAHESVADKKKRVLVY